MLGKRKAETFLAPPCKRARVATGTSTFEKMQRAHFFHLVKRYCNFLHFGTVAEREKDYTIMTQFLTQFKDDEQVIRARAYFLSNMQVRLQTILNMPVDVHRPHEHVTRIYMLWQCTPPAVCVMTSRIFWYLRLRGIR